MGERNYMQNLGQAIVHNGIIYSRVSGTPVVGSANTIDPADLVNFSDYTWVYSDDNGIITYSAERMAVAQVYHNNASYVVGAKSWSTPWFENYPTTGIIRFWASSGGASNMRIYVNGVHRATLGSAGFARAKGVAVVEGDTVQFYNNETYSPKTFYSRTYPYTYDGNDPYP